jgi:hypothetical protein
MGKQKEPQEPLVITTIRAPRAFWSKVRTQAFNEGLAVGQLTLKALAEYLKREGGRHE